MIKTNICSMEQYEDSRNDIEVIIKIKPSISHLGTYDTTLIREITTEVNHIARLISEHPHV